MITFLMTLYGTFVSRWHGGGFFGGGKFIKTLAWAVPFGYAGYLALAPLGLAWWLLVLAVLACLSLCFGGKATGGGNGIDYGSQQEGDPEFLEFIVRWAQPYVSAKMYDSLINAAVGFAAVSGLFLVLMLTAHPVLGIAVASGGLARAIGYVVGWTIGPKVNWPKNFQDPTEIGEALAGTFAFIPLGVTITYLM